MTKAEIDFLGRVFARNVEGLSLQSKSKMAKDLEARGLIFHERRTVGKDRFGAICIDGYSLTYAGNYAYCSSERCRNAHEES